MKKHWIQNANVMIDPGSGSVLVNVTAPGSFAGGTMVPAQAGVGEALVADIETSHFVWVAAPMDNDGNATNSKPIFLGDAGGQNMPLKPGNYRGVVIRIDDPRKLYVRSVVAGEGVVYRITSGGPVETNT